MLVLADAQMKIRLSITRPDEIQIIAKMFLLAFEKRNSAVVVGRIGRGPPSSVGTQPSPRICSRFGSKD